LALFKSIVGTSCASLTVKLRNQWPGEAVEVVDGQDGAVVLKPHSDAVLAIPVQAAKDYLVRRVVVTRAPQRFEAVCV
jgi:hypothetical protein